MKKRFVFIVFCLVCLGIVGCTNAEDSYLSARRPMIMVDGVIYMDTGNVLSVDIDDADILGTISSSVSATEIPSQNGESNFSSESSPYAYYDDGLAVFLDSQWIFFEKNSE